MAVIRERGDSHEAIVRLTVDGQKFRESRTFKTKPLAKAWADKLEAKIKLDGLPQRVLSQMTLGELMLAHLEKIQKVKPVRRQMVWEINRLAVEFSKLKLTDLTPNVFTEFGMNRAKQGVSGATVLHDLSTISGVLSAALAVQNVRVTNDSVSKAIDALSHLGVVHPSESRDRRPTEGELAKIREEMERISHYPQTKVPGLIIMELAIALPRRISEITSMLWEDYSGDVIILRDTKHPVRPRTETVPVPPAARAIIDTLPKIDARILPYKEDSATSQFERVCNRLMIHDLTFHDLRHHGISLLFEQGLQIQEVAQISGHKSWNTLKRYTNLKAKDVTKKLKRLPLPKPDSDEDNQA